VDNRGRGSISERAAEMDGKPERWQQRRRYEKIRRI
jgi:hypothetical protein